MQRRQGGAPACACDGPAWLVGISIARHAAFPLAAAAVQTWRQQFSWTLDGLPAAIAARDAQLLHARSAHPGGLVALLQQLSGGRRWLASAAEKVGGLEERQVQRGSGSCQLGGRRSLNSPLPRTPPLLAVLATGVYPPSLLQAVAELGDVPGGLAGMFEDGWKGGSQQEQQAQQAADVEAGSPPGGPRSVQAPGSPRLQLSAAEATAAHAQLERLSLSRLSSVQLSFQRERQPPMFCFELAVCLFAWSKYAYRHWVSHI